MNQTINGAEAVRPHTHYRDIFYRELMSHLPTSVLDVGCGEGALMEKLQTDKVKVWGLDPCLQTVCSLKAKGLKALEGKAEALPFQDDAVDFVVSEFALHHFANFKKFVSEALRVAKRGIVLLDQWYDTTVSESALAERFDIWCKNIDQLAGETHFPSIKTGDLHGMFKKQASTPLDIAMQTHLLILPVSRKRVKEIAQAQLQKVQVSEVLVQELNAIMVAVDEIGMNDDGAVIFSAIKSNSK